MQEQKKLAGGIIRVFAQTGKIDSSYTNAQGTFLVKLPLNQNYIIEFSDKKSQTRFVNISATVPASDRNKEFSYYLAVSLSETSTLLLKTPIASIAFDTNSHSFDQNVSYTKTIEEIKKQIDSLELLHQQKMQDTLLTNNTDKELQILKSRLKEIIDERANILYEAQKQASLIMENAYILSDNLITKANNTQKNQTAANKNIFQMPDSSELMLLNLDSETLRNDTSIQRLNSEINKIIESASENTEDSLTKKEKILLIRQKLIDEARLQLALTKLNAQTHEDSLTIQTKEQQINEAEQALLQAQIEIKSAKDKIRIQNLEIKTQQTLIFSVASILILLLLLFIVVYRNSLKNKKTNKILEKQNQVLAKLNEELDALSIVARETDNAIILTDSEGNFEWVNQGFTRIFGYNMQEFIEKVGKNIVNKDSDKKLWQQLQAGIRAKKTTTYEFETETRSGERIWIHSTLTPIQNKDGQTYRFVAIDSDITQQKKSEKEITEQHDIVKKQHENITGSIRYAQTIQTAMLLDEKHLLSFLDAFVLYKPKDIVSGDFYWMAKIKSTEKYLIAVADCTGHGVPGAFMSLIGNRLLNEIVKQNQIYNPSEILEELDNLIKQVLSQDETLNNDGMDICLCLIEKNEASAQNGINIDKKNNTFTITFSGAKRPLFYYSQHEKKVLREKGTTRSIGGRKRRREHIEEPFGNIKIEARQGDILYLCSDGIADQASPEGKKFGIQGLVELLEKQAQYPMQMQKEKIDEELKKHQGNAGQRDDITIIGLKL